MRETGLFNFFKPDQNPQIPLVDSLARFGHIFDDLASLGECSELIDLSREMMKNLLENPPSHSQDAPGLESAAEFLARLERVARGDTRKARAWMHPKFEELKRLHVEGKVSPETMRAYLDIFNKTPGVEKQAQSLELISH